MGVTFKWNKSVKGIVSGLLKDEKTAYFAANNARRLMEPYVPMYTGSLAANTTIDVKGSQAEIHYTMPYAATVYYGARTVKPKKGKTRKIKLKFNKEKHPLATSYWDKAMMKTRKKELINDIQNFIRGQTT